MNLWNIFHVNSVVHQMQIACTQMATPFVSDVMQGRMATIPLTIIA